MNEEKVIQLLLQHSHDIQELKETVATLPTKEDLGRISNTLDTLVGIVRKTDQEVTMMVHGMRRIEDKVEKVENRVGVLEKERR